MLHAETWRFVRSAPVGLSSVVVEPLSHRLFVYGSWDQGGQFRELWSLSLDSLAQWQRVSTIGAGPDQRTNSVLFADPVRNQIIAYGGRGPSSALFGCLADRPVGPPHLGAAGYGECARHVWTEFRQYE